jgi:hypothetical protein
MTEYPETYNPDTSIVVVLRRLAVEGVTSNLSDVKH